MAAFWNPSSEDAQMKKASEEMRLRAIVVVDSRDLVSRLTETLSKRDISASVKTDPDKALDECRREPPHLAIVGKVLGSTTGARFLAELLKVFVDNLYHSDSG